MPQQFNGDLLPDADGRDLGSSSQRWDGFFRNVQIDGSITSSNLAVPCGFGGASAGADILSAINSLPSTGGTVDCRCQSGSQVISSDIFSGITKNVHLIFGTATYSVTASLNVPANVALTFTRGGSLVPADGVTITIKGNLSAPLSRIFSLNGTGTISFSRGRIRDLHPEWWGAAGDGVVVNDGSISATTTTLSSATAAFTASDVGKIISVEGAGASGVALSTTIAAYISSSSVTLGAAASSTVSSATVMFGTDDGAAINAALSAASVALGGRVKLSSAYATSTAITMKSGGVSIEGAGAGSAAALTTFGFRGPRLLILGGIYGLVVSDSTNQVQRGFSARGLTIIGSSLGKAGLRLGAVQSDVSNAFVSASFQDIHIEGFTSSSVSHDVPSGEPSATGGAGIFITRGQDVLLQNVTARKNYRGLHESSDHAATTYEFHRCQFRESTAEGALLRDSINVSFDDCIFESNGSEGLKVQPQVSGAFCNFLSVRDSYFEDNITTTGTHEILLDGQAASTGIFNFVFENVNMNVGTVSGAKGFKAIGAGVEVGYLKNVSLSHATNTNIETVTTSGKILVIDAPADSSPAHSSNVLDSGTQQIVVGDASLTLGPITVNSGVAQGTGVKHGRVTTGSIAAGGSAAVTLTWGGTAFTNTSYTVAASVLEATASTSTLRVHHIESQSTTTVVVRVVNDDGGAPHTGTLHCVAFHD